MGCRVTLFSVAAALLAANFIGPTTAQAQTFTFEKSFGSLQIGAGNVLSLAFDASDNLYATDGSLLKFTDNGTYLLSAPGVTGAYGVAADSGNSVYVSGSGAGTVTEYNSVGQDGETIISGLTFAGGMAIGSNNNIFVDVNTYNNGMIDQFTNSGSLVSTINSGVLGGNLVTSLGVAGDGDLYAASNHGGIARFDSSGNLISTFGSAQVSYAVAIALDKKGNVFVCDQTQNQITEFSSSGTFIQSFGSNYLNAPEGLAVDNQGNVFVGDTQNHRIVEFAVSGSSAAPEPAALALLLTSGAPVAGIVLRRRKQK